MLDVTPFATSSMSTGERRGRSERLQVPLSTEELTAVDRFRFENRLPKGSSDRPRNHAARAA